MIVKNKYTLIKYYVKNSTVFNCFEILYCTYFVIDSNNLYYCKIYYIFIKLIIGITIHRFIFVFSILVYIVGMFFIFWWFHNKMFYFYFKEKLILKQNLELNPLRCMHI